VNSKRVWLGRKSRRIGNVVADVSYWRELKFKVIQIFVDKKTHSSNQYINNCSKVQQKRRELKVNDDGN
jgi:hypothetical protein